MTLSEAGKLGYEKSKHTRLILYKQNLDIYYSNPKKCKMCGKTISYKKRFNTFCSSRCSGLYNNFCKKDSYLKKHHRIKKHCVCNHSINIKRSQKTKQNILEKFQDYNINNNAKIIEINGQKILQMFCLNCRKIFPHVKYNKKFCSLDCQHDFEFKKRCEQIERNGEFPVGYGGECSRPTVFKYLVRKYGRKCSICNNTEWMGKPIPLIVDHIDGNAYNNKIDNFRLVCGNCDMQLPTYKNKNKGKGRLYRKLHEREVLNITTNSSTNNSL